MKLICIWLIATSLGLGDSPERNSAKNLLAEMENLYLADSTIAKFDVKVNRPSGTNKVNIEWFSRGRSTVFLKVEKQDVALNVLKVGKELFYYDTVEDYTRHISQGGSTRLFFKSDFSRDDFMQINSLTEEYKVSKQETEKYWVLTLLPHLKTPIVWDKIVITIDRALRIPVSKQYFDDKGRIAKTLHYSNPITVDHRMLPTTWEMKNHLRKGYSSKVEITEIQQNVPLKPYLFSMKNLKNLLTIDLDSDSQESQNGSKAP